MARALLRGPERGLAASAIAARPLVIMTAE